MGQQHTQSYRRNHDSDETSAGDCCGDSPFQLARPVQGILLVIWAEYNEEFLIPRRFDILGGVFGLELSRRVCGSLFDIALVLVD